MEQPVHDLRAGGTNTAEATPRRLAAGVIVALLHVGIIYAIAAGLASQFIEKLPEELNVAVEKQTIPPKAPPPPPPELKTPPPPFVPPPDITIQTEAPTTNAIVTTNKPQPAEQPKPQISSPASIGRPHVCGDKYYPPVSMRLNEEGTTLLSFKILTDGSITDITVAKSSGHDRLDQAAITCAGSWRYKPATQNGQPVEVPWQTQVQWKLGK
jgi:protein TonB